MNLSIQLGILSSQLTKSYFSEGLKSPTSNRCLAMVYPIKTIIYDIDNRYHRILPYLEYYVYDEFSMMFKTSGNGMTHSHDGYL